MKRILLMLTLALVALVGCEKDPKPGQDATAFESPANCYIVSQAGTYSFKTVKGNSSESVGKVASAEVLWESFGTDVAPAVGDLVKSVSYKDGKIDFKTTDKKGNAVIAAKDANGNILWSWHIWMTDEPESHEYFSDAGTMMDRNLGATSATPGDVGALGLFYQWGRKDPFLGSSSISEVVEAKSTITWPSAVSSDSSNGTIAYATTHPTTYITANEGNGDWYYTGSSKTDDTRWTTSESSKSINDPCPAGWRVPDGGENGVWARLLGLEEINYPFATTRKGMNFSGKFGSDQTIWYPFAGFYLRYEGRLYIVGEYGAYWSASPCPGYDNLRYSLNLDPVIAYPGWDNVKPVEKSRCATAMSVRCIKEGTAKAVKVSQIKLVGMPTTDFTVGRSVTISAVITPDDATNKRVTFTSSNPEVATVEYIQSENNYSLALLKAIGPGKATITATANDGSGVKAEAEVDVLPASNMVSDISITMSKSEVKVGYMVRATATVSPEDAENREITWSSSNTAIARVRAVEGANNKVDVIGVSPGSVIITATAKDGSGVTASVPVTVVDGYQSITLTTSKAIGETIDMLVQGELAASEVEGAVIKDSKTYDDGYTLYTFELESQTVTIKQASIAYFLCTEDQITSVDLTNCPDLKSLYCYRNAIKGENMTNLVKSLPDRTGKTAGKFVVYAKSDSKEKNEITKADVAIAKAKNWNVLDWYNNEYEGI